MYLSRVELDLRNRETLRALASPTRFHGAVESAFSGPRERRLWRLDRLNGGLWLLLVSEKIPELDHIVRQFGSSASIAETRDYAPFLARIEVGGQWRFRLTANPVQSVKDGKTARGTVRNHVTVEQQERWLAERASRHGFALDPEGFRVTEARWLIFAKGIERRRVAIRSVTFEGLLRVTDTEAFRATLIGGIGRGKAYGQGLLTIMGT